MSAKKEHIIATALQLFQKEGYNGVPLNEILRQAGVSKGGFYHYFNGKEELLEIALNKWIDSEIVSIVNYLHTSSDGFRVKLKGLFSRFARRDKSNLDLFDVPMNDAEPNFIIVFEAINCTNEMQNIIKEAVWQLIGEYQKFLKYGVMTGELRKDLDIKSAAMCLVTMQEGLLIMSIFDGECDWERESNRLYAFIWDCIRLI